MGARRWTALAAILGPALALWSAGGLGATSPALFRGLLAAAFSGGLAGAVSGRWLGRGGPRAGAVALVATAAFPLALFRVSEGPLPVRRRVTPPPQPVQELRLVDFNAWHDHPRFRDAGRRAERLAAALAELAPDVVVLQEAWRTAASDLAAGLADGLAMDAAYARANGSRRLIGFEEGSAVLSRLPILAAERWVLGPHAPPWTRRIALRVRLDTGGGTALELVAVHLTNAGESAAARQAAGLAARLGAAAVLAGDWNAPSGGAALRPFEQRGFADLVPGGIDHVLLDGASGWRAASASWTLRPGDLAALPGGAPLSDHPGIVVDLVRLPGA